MHVQVQKIFFRFAVFKNENNVNSIDNQTEINKRI